MKLRIILIAVMAMFISGCMDSMMAVPAAAISGTVNVVSSVWDAVTFWN
jgi:PBP1b-binding outer membrane lipoprotein LpoB